MHRSFFIFEEFHATIGLIQKNLAYLVSLLGVRQNQGEVRQYHGFSESETFWFLFWSCLLFKYFAFVFLMFINDEIFYSGSVNDNSNLRKLEAKCRYSLFSGNQRVFMALRKSFKKNYLNSSLFFFPSFFILLAVWFLSLTTQSSKRFPLEVQVNFFY